MRGRDRVLVIGLDGATWDVLEPWICDGSLPNLGRLRQNGSWGTLRSTIPPVSAPAWSSFMTGKGPGKHGVFDFTDLFGKRKRRDGKPVLLNARDVKSSTLWDILGHHGREVVVINVTMTYPPRPVNGVMITGMLTPGNAPTFTYPPELTEELTDYVIDLDRFMDRKPGQGTGPHPEMAPPPLCLVREYQEMLEKRAGASLSLMSSKPWGFFVVVFSGTDKMGHALWPYNRSPDVDDPRETQAICRALHDYYVRLDEIVGQLVERAGKDTTTLVVSDHGMGPGHTRRIHLNNWLHQNGWLSVEADRRPATNLDGWLRRLRLSRDRVGRAIFRVPGLSRSGLVKTLANRPFANIDLRRSAAYGVPIRGVRYLTGIRIGPEVERTEALRQEIMEGLLGIVDPENGRPPVQWVRRGEDCYHGPYANDVPDIMAGVDPDYSWGYHIGPYSSIATRPQLASRLGRHRLEGVFIASGPSVAPQPEPLADLDIVDCAPTVLYLMGLPVPSDMDGRVLTEVLDPTALESCPVKQGDPVGFWPEEHRAFYGDEFGSGEDDEQVRSRLRALGYLE